MQSAEFLDEDFSCSQVQFEVNGTEHQHVDSFLWSHGVHLPW